MFGVDVVARDKVQTKHLAVSSQFSHHSIGWKLVLAFGVSGGSTGGSHIFLESLC
jgi:hypothetical protein